MCLATLSVGVSTYSCDGVARWSISCRELQKLLNSDAASVRRHDFHAETETTILEGKKTDSVDMISENAGKVHTISTFNCLMIFN